MRRSAAPIRFATFLLGAGAVHALDGGTPRIVADNGWKAFEVITEGDDPSGDGFSYAMPGTFDGAGARLVDPATIRVYVNHETGDASISEVDLDVANLRAAILDVIAGGGTGGTSFVVSARQAYGRFSADGGSSFTTTSDNSTTSFSRFCSGQAYAPHTFGPNRGFVDPIYVTGEEVGGGRLFALDGASRDLFQLSGTVGSAPGGTGGLPFDSWENAALLDTGETTHVALLLSPDGGTSQMKLFVGEKGRDASGNSSNAFLARNGLAYGSWYYLDGSLPTALGGTSSGTFDTTVSGALGSTKLEDVDTSPSDPTRMVLGDQDSGVFTFVFDLVFAGGFSAGASGFTVTKVANSSGGSGSLDSPDNVDWTDVTTLGGTSYPHGLVVVNEDNSTGEIWRMLPDGSDPIRIGATTVGAESTGIFDLSESVGYRPGSILITNNQGSPSSMTLLIHPDATAAGSPGAGSVSQLLVDKASPSVLRLSWQPSCSADDDDYAVYEGALGDFASHTVVTCSTSGETTIDVPPASGDRYWLVVPLDGPDEGSYGRDGDGSERPAGIVTCGPQNVARECP